ncbi:3006_t:CDS:2 [Funneliformis caledonium]|uniref:3006_t:CDS:1 n=1 Tax=Funneliformis caledonium TaxID=1117310 RepID=A0A9N9I9A4_9GLOM|nr:3006_t:CDS:2 [Funneliformis caledonium]
MTSSVALGRAFEEKNVNLLKAKNVQVERTGPRGSGDRYARAHKGRKICRQCKAWKKKKIGPAVIREMIGALANEPRQTIGVVVGLTKDSFTNDAVKAAEKAGIITTDSNHL